MPDPDAPSFEGMALAHGALDELGFTHAVEYRPADSEGVSSIVDWAGACLARQAFMGSTYGEIGGRCLAMLPGTWDDARQCSLAEGGVCSRFILPPGPVTLVRFGRIDGRYVIHLARGRAR